MEIKAKLLKPITTGERFDFIIKYNHELGYEIRDTEEEIQAWGKRKKKKPRKKRKESPCFL